MKRFALFLFLGFSSLSSFAYDEYIVNDTEDLMGKTVVTKNSEKKEGRSPAMKKARLDSFMQAGFAKGLPYGRYERFKQIQISLDQNRTLFHRIYKVDHLYNEGGLLQPGVALSASNLFQRNDSGTVLENSRQRYELVAQPTLVTQPLDWYTYLVSPSDLYVVEEDNLGDLKIENKEEQEAFDNAYKSGFAEGMAQAELDFNGRIAALTTVIEGMYTYTDLIHRGLLKAPEVSRTTVPVSGNQTVLTLSTNALALQKLSEFNLNTEQYKALLLINGKATK